MDLTGGDSDDLSDIQPNAHAIAVTLFSRHPQIQQGGPLPNAGGHTIVIQQTNSQNVRFTQFLGDALDQERVCWIGQGRRASQHQEDSSKVGAQNFEAAAWKWSIAHMRWKAVLRQDSTIATESWCPIGLPTLLKSSKSSDRTWSAKR